MRQDITLYTLDTTAILEHAQAAEKVMLPQARAAYDETSHAGTRAALLGTALMQRALLGVTDESQLAVGEFGKPVLVAGPAHNFSNADGLVVLGVAADARCASVGVDVERVQRADDHIARAYFSHEEAAWMRAAGPSDEARRFCHLWTRLEARLKAEGCGFGIDPQHHPEVLEGWLTTTTDMGDYVISCAARQEPRVELAHVTVEGLRARCGL